MRAGLRKKDTLRPGFTRRHVVDVREPATAGPHACNPRDAQQPGTACACAPALHASWGDHPAHRGADRGWQIESWGAANVTTLAGAGNRRNRPFSTSSGGEVRCRLNVRSSRGIIPGRFRRADAHSVIQSRRDRDKPTTGGAGFTGWILSRAAAAMNSFQLNPTTLSFPSGSSGRKIKLQYDNQNRRKNACSV